MSLRAHTLVTLDFPPKQDGGIARWMDELARGLVEAGRDTRVLTRSRGAAIRAHDLAHPAELHRLPGHGWVKRHRLYLSLYAPLLGRHLGGRVVHAATFGVAAPLLPAIRRGGGRLAVYVHGLELLSPGEDAPTLARVLAEADVVVANSGHVAELARARGAAGERTHVLAPAIDPARVTPTGPDLRAAWGVEGRPVILTLARLVPRKGQDRVIAALPRVRAEVPGAVYVVAGQGPDRARLEALARELGLGDAVRFVGFVPEHEVAAAYRSADVYAMPAREEPGDVEGFGITFLEANAAARPVVAGRSGGIADAVIDGVTGLLVEPQDVEAIGAAIAGLLAAPERRAALGAAGRARVERELSRAAMVARVLELTEV